MTLSPQARKWVRGIVDFAGLALFVIGAVVNHGDLVKATWWLVAGSALGLLVALVLERRIAPVPLASGGAALLFGGLTLIFHDARFIKMKPTFLYIAFATFLIGGLMLKRNPLKMFMSEAVRLTEAGWRTLTLRYGFFFLALAVLNEIVWRTPQTANYWLGFKTIGIPILLLGFSLSQAPLIMKSAEEQEAAEKPAAPTE